MLRKVKKYKVFVLTEKISALQSKYDLLKNYGKHRNNFMSIALNVHVS